MCKSLEEGGLRCAADTRPPYTRALRAALDVAAPDAAALETLATTAQAYSSTPTGHKAVEEQIDRIRESHPDLASLLLVADTRGQAEYRQAKELTHAIQQEVLRAQVIDWAANLPTGPLAGERYEQMLAQDLAMDPDTVRRTIGAQQEANDTGDLPDLDDLHATRFIAVDEDGSHVGTGTDPVTLRVIADLEAMAAKGRRSRREQLAVEDADGNTVLPYDNDNQSEIIESVRYQPATKTLDITLRPRRGTGTGPTYTYRDVSKSLLQALTSARSMGRFYAYVFSKEQHGASFAGRTANDYSFAVQAANYMTPVRRATGPVPVKTPTNLAN